MSINVVVVDDEPSVSRWFASQVDWADYGYEVIGYFHKALEALLCLKRTHVDLLITDICMPDLDGLELIREAKSLNPQICIIVISAHSNFDYAKEAIKLGVENYLLKPIDQEELAESLHKAQDNIWSLQSGHDKNLYRRNVLNSWLSHTVNSFTLANQIKIANISIDADSFRVVIFRTINLQPINIDMIEDEMNCVFSDAGLTMHSVDDNQASLIVIFCGKLSDWRYYITLLHNRLATGMKDNIHIAVGLGVTRFNHVYLSYECAKRYVAVIPMTAAGVLFCDDYVAHNDSRDVVDNIQNIRPLMLLTDFDRQIHDLNTKYKDDTQFRLKIITLIAHFLEATGLIEQKYDLPKRNTLMYQFRLLRTKSEINDWIRQFFDSLQEDIHERYYTLHAHIRYAIQVIHESFTDANLSLAVISDKINVNAAYLGQLFHSQTGRYFNQYLCDVRLDAVAILLVESNDAIGEIALKTGFASQSYLNRLFKKRYKLTPNLFRQTFRNEK